MIATQTGGPGLSGGRSILDDEVFTSDSRPPNRIVEAEGKPVDIRRQAWIEGKFERPRTEETVPDSNEQAIVTHWHRRYLQLNEKSNHALQEFAESFAKTEEMPATERIDDVLARGRKRIRELRDGSRDGLIRRLTAARGLWNERERFRECGGLRRPASFPTSLRHHFAIVALIVVIESAANMYFFAQGNTLGYLGGVLQAMLLSLMNVGLAVAVGRFGLRALHLTNIRLRRTALAAILAYAVFLLAFNLVAGHYRDLLAERPQHALRLAIPSTTQAPLNISFDSMMLLVAGLLAAGLGLYKGYTSDDPYPGYGRLERRYQKAADDLDVARAQFREALGRVVDETETLLTGLRAESARRIDELERIRTLAEKLVERYENRREEYEGDCQQWLNEYRQENIKVRCSPVPAYFDQRHVFPDELERERLDTFPSRITTARGRHAALDKAIHAVERDRGKRWEEVQNDTDAFLRDVETRAERELGAVGQGMPAPYA